MTRPISIFYVIPVHYLPTLRLYFDGGRSNDYRLREHCVEFRASEGPWRALDDSDIQLHYRFNTEVAHWLQNHQLEVHLDGRKRA